MNIFVRVIGLEAPEHSSLLICVLDPVGSAFDVVALVIIKWANLK